MFRSGRLAWVRTCFCCSARCRWPLHFFATGEVWSLRIDEVAKRRDAADEQLIPVLPDGFCLKPGGVNRLSARWSWTAGPVAAILGLVAVALGGLQYHRLQTGDGLFSLVSHGVDGLAPLSLVLLMASGFAVGNVWPGSRPLAIGLWTIAALPLVALAEMVSDPTSHNLWPFELVIYGLMAAPGFVGAYFARRLAEKASFRKGLG